jgi:hypothetical protein
MLLRDMEEADAAGTTCRRIHARRPGWRSLVCFVMAVVCWGFGFYGHALSAS